MRLESQRMIDAIVWANEQQPISAHAIRLSLRMNQTFQWVTYVLNKRIIYEVASNKIFNITF